MDLDCIGAFAIKVFQREVLLHLLEKQLNLPSMTVYGDNFFGIRVHIVGKQRYELVLLYIRISDYAGFVAYRFSSFLWFCELHVLYPDLH